MNIRDVAERLVWTVAAAFLGGLAVGGAFDLSTVEAGGLAAATAGVNFLLLVARARLAVLPEPGAGLPGLPTNDSVNIAERLGLPHEDEPTTRDRGAVNNLTVIAVGVAIVAVIAIMWLFGEAPRT